MVLIFLTVPGSRALINLWGPPNIEMTVINNLIKSLQITQTKEYTERERERKESKNNKLINYKSHTETHTHKLVSKERAKGSC